MRLPLLLIRTLGVPASMMATQELVVPRSMPMILDIVWFLHFRTVGLCKCGASGGGYGRAGGWRIRGMRGPNGHRRLVRLPKWQGWPGLPRSVDNEPRLMHFSLCRYLPACLHVPSTTD